MVIRNISSKALKALTVSIATGLALSLFPMGRSLAADFKITKIAQIGDPTPDGFGNFLYFDPGPVISGNTVVFAACLGDIDDCYNDVPFGLYIHENETLDILADINNPLPDAGVDPESLFEDGFRFISISGDRLAFVTNGTIYLRQGDTVNIFASSNIPALDDIDTFSRFGDLSLDGSHLAFSKVTYNNNTSAYLSAGIYLANENTVKVIADLNTPIPGLSENFADFGAINVSDLLSLDAGRVAFYGANRNFISGESLRGGIYLNDGDTLQTVVDTNTLIPDSSIHFTEFFGLSLDGNQVAFAAYGVDPNTFEFRRGIYVSDGGVLRTIADNTHPVLGCDSFDGDVALENGNIAFKGCDRLFTNLGGELSSLPASFFDFADEGLNGNSLIFVGSFDREPDYESYAVYRADLVTTPSTSIPEPSSVLSLSLLGGSFLLFRKKFTSSYTSS